MNTLLALPALFLRSIDSGEFFRRPFSWLYTIFAALHLLVPVVVLYIGIDHQLFSMGAAFFFGFLMLWAFIVAASWLSFQIWWNRKQIVLTLTESDAEFLATPVFAHLLQTSGESAGSWMAIVGVGAGMVTTIFMRDGGFGSMLPIPFLDGGFISIVIMPVVGYLTIVASRFVAEQARALAAIANNTKQMRSARV